MAKKDKYGYREALPRFFKADYELQNRVGTGAIDAAAISKAQAYLDSVKDDVTPQLRDSLDALKNALDEARTVSYGREEFLQPVMKHLMDVKSISGMFGEMMICRISAFVLTFLEDVRKFDNDIVEIVGVYLKAAKMLMDLKIKSETDAHGQNILVEIRGATKRYYDKHAKAVKG